jgi:speckle-type POZ protein
LVRYIYAGKIENLNTRSPRLLEAADKYQLSELKEICEEMLCSSLTVDTCLECLVLADMHNAADLKVSSTVYSSQTSSPEVQYPVRTVSGRLGV